MKLSVVITTYNHEPFVAEALDSVLRQRVSFPFEIIVGDDCSSDGTRRILREFQARCPELIHLVFPEVNLGAGGNRLSAKVLAEARGEYVAFLDGDDYWLGTGKLERQVRFLDDHAECSMCCHRAYNLYPDGRLMPYEDNFDYETGRLFYSLRDIMFQNFIPTCSVVFRKRLLTRLPRSFLAMPAGDWFFNVLLAEHGTIGWLDEVWGVRRVHPGGVISMKSRAEKLRFNIRCVHIIDSYFKGAYRREARARLAYLHRELGLRLREGRKRWRGAWHAAMSLRLAPSDQRWSRVETLRLIGGETFASIAERVVGLVARSSGKP